MAMETAAAILTKLAFEQNTDLKSRLAVVQGKDKELVALIMPLFRQILSGMESDRQTHDKFPSAVPERSPRQIDKRPQPNEKARPTCRITMRNTNTAMKTISAAKPNRLPAFAAVWASGTPLRVLLVIGLR